MKKGYRFGSPFFVFSQRSVTRIRYNNKRIDYDSVCWNCSGGSNRELARRFYFEFVIFTTSCFLFFLKKSFKIDFASRSSGM